MISDMLRTFDCIEWECELYSGRHKALWYDMNYDIIAYDIIVNIIAYDIIVNIIAYDIIVNIIPVISGTLHFPGPWPSFAVQPYLSCRYISQ
jgi:hypothetical protein